MKIWPFRLQRSHNSIRERVSTPQIDFLLETMICWGLFAERGVSSGKGNSSHRTRIFTLHREQTSYQRKTILGIKIPVARKNNAVRFNWQLIRSNSRKSESRSNILNATVHAAMREGATKMLPTRRRDGNQGLVNFRTRTHATRTKVLGKYKIDACEREVVRW